MYIAAGIIIMMFALILFMVMPDFNVKVLDLIGKYILPLAIFVCGLGIIFYKPVGHMDRYFLGKDMKCIDQRSSMQWRL